MSVGNKQDVGSGMESILLISRSASVEFKCAVSCCLKNMSSREQCVVFRLVLLQSFETQIVFLIVSSNNSCRLTGWEGAMISHDSNMDIKGTLVNFEMTMLRICF